MLKNKLTTTDKDNPEWHERHIAYNLLPTIVEFIYYTQGLIGVLTNYIYWGPIIEENKSKIGQERNSMQQGRLYQYHRPTPWMQESVSMHKSPTPVKHSRMNQARSEEEEKRGRQESERPGGWWKKRQPNKTKTYLRNLNKAYLMYISGQQ